ncbi:MAG TPA: zinc-dependent alcohol dehydrogenase, partial [Hyphomonas sp.]|nr:zinc-dependent alcohol dehydrogenase [Hyphomonas sp.]
QESLDFAKLGAVKAHTATARLEEINSVFDKMLAGDIDGRIVLDFS